MSDATDNRFYREAPKLPVNFITREDADNWSDALADVLCWFRGFRAARDDGSAAVAEVLPPGLDKLRDLKICLDKIVRD